MPIKILLLVLIMGASPFAKAQLFPDGTKLHIAHLVSYHETGYQKYLITKLVELPWHDDSYTRVTYPTGGNYRLRLESNKLFEFHGGGNLDYLLFDFNAQVGDSLTIYHHYYLYLLHLTDENKLGKATIRIDSIHYEYYYNELEEKDSLKRFFYSGIINVPAYPYFPDSITVPYLLRSSRIEKILTLETSTVNSYLGVNLGPFTGSSDHERLRCVEFPDGKMIKMEWWYNLAGNTLPCDYTFNVGQPEFSQKANMYIYPIPAQNYIQVDGFEGPVSITNMLGQILMETEVLEAKQIDIRALPNGMYYLTSTKNNSLHKLFSISH